MAHAQQAVKPQKATAKSAARIDTTKKPVPNPSATTSKKTQSATKPLEKLESLSDVTSVENPAPGEELFTSDPALDRKIIVGMLSDRKRLFDELAKDGMTQSQILRRAADLGISDALIRQVNGVANELASERPGGKPHITLGPRTCLSCDRVFLSTGPGNRLCMRCRGGDAGLAQV